MVERTSSANMIIANNNVLRFVQIDFVISFESEACEESEMDRTIH